MRPLFLFILFIHFLALVSCRSKSNAENFYSYNRDFDLWRFPLIEPYELISPTNSGDWFLVIPNHKFKHKDFFSSSTEFHLSNIDSVAILDSLIILHCKNLYWPKLSGMYNTTVLLNNRNGIHYIFSVDHHKKEFIDTLSSLSTSAPRMHDLSKLVDSFTKDLKLPDELLSK